MGEASLGSCDVSYEHDEELQKLTMWSGSAAGPFSSPATEPATAAATRQLVDAECGAESLTVIGLLGPTLLCVGDSILVDILVTTIVLLFHLGDKLLDSLDLGLIVRFPSLGHAN